MGETSPKLDTPETRDTEIERLSLYPIDRLKLDWPVCWVINFNRGIIMLSHEEKRELPSLKNLYDDNFGLPKPEQTQVS